MLDPVELKQLEKAIQEELTEILLGRLTFLNRSGELEDLLQLLGLEKLLYAETNNQRYKTGIILVIGQTKVKPEAFHAIGKNLGISKDRFELHLDYNDPKTFKFEKTKNNPEYALIMAGPMPHSGISKGNASGILTALEQPNSGYPPVIRLGSNGLKITKTNFREGLQKALEDGLITAA